MSVRERVELGDMVEDRITGIRGIAVCRSEWLYGCIRMAVQRPGLTKEEKTHDLITVDEPQLKIVKCNALGLAEPDQIFRESSRKVSYGPRPEVQRGHEIAARG
jgi:hypothetical protein